MIRALVFALVATFAVSSTALAGGGGGGTKKDATVKITNDLPAVFAVIINPTLADIAAIEGAIPDFSAALTELKNRGGIDIQAGKEGSFKVKSGNQTIRYYQILPGPALGPTGQVVRVVGKGKTLSFKASSL